MTVKLQRIVTGGQTGVDRAALDVAIALGIPHGGWCPKGRLAEDGRISALYQLQETPLADTSQRTEWNVRDSHGTLILADPPLTGGTLVTHECAVRYERPLLCVELSASPNPVAFCRWLEQYAIGVLNIAGPREGTGTGASYERAKRHLITLLS